MKNSFIYTTALAALICLFTGCTKEKSTPEENIIGTWQLSKSHSAYTQHNGSENYDQVFKCDGVGMFYSNVCSNCSNGGYSETYRSFSMTLKLAADNTFVIHEQTGLADVKGVWEWNAAKTAIKLTSSYSGIQYPITTHFFLDSCTLSITLLSSMQLNADFSSRHSRLKDFTNVRGTFIFKKNVPASSGTGTVTPTVTYGTMTDERDGKTYKTVKIGRQTWMAENLKYQCPGAYAYDGDIAKVDTFGYLYSGAIYLISPPAGWHIPTETEFLELGDSTSKRLSGDYGTHLKSVELWQQPSKADNSTGFSLLPGGIGHLAGTSTPVNYFANTYFMATLTYITNAGSRGIAMMDASSSSWVYGPAESTHLLSVRYIKDN